MTLHLLEIRDRIVYMGMSYWNFQSKFHFGNLLEGTLPEVSTLHAKARDQ